MVAPQGAWISCSRDMPDAPLLGRESGSIPAPGLRAPLGALACARQWGRRRRGAPPRRTRYRLCAADDANDRACRLYDDGRRPLTRGAPSRRCALRGLPASSYPTPRHVAHHLAMFAADRECVATDYRTRWPARATAPPSPRRSDCARAPLRPAAARPDARRFNMPPTLGEIGSPGDQPRRHILRQFRAPCPGCQRFAYDSAARSIACRRRLSNRGSAVIRPGAARALHAALAYSGVSRLRLGHKSR